ncbi:MAG TPA: hypothetical protein VFM97_07740 [Gammaproteobacteria bacterium]|nr:hypothetical protein [Gammaproteobacteria bacterium]
MTARLARIILVMKRPGNVRATEGVLAPLGAACVAVGDETALECALDRGPGVAVVDASDFGSRAGSLCDILRSRELPFIVLAAARGAAAGVTEGFFGAAHYLEKPVGKGLLQQLMYDLMQRAATDAGEERRCTQKS